MQTPLSASLTFFSDEQLSADDIRILNIVLVDHLDELGGSWFKTWDCRR